MGDKGSCGAKFRAQAPLGGGQKSPGLIQGINHSPFLVPDLRDQFLIAFAQGWLLVCAYQASTLQEELGQWGTGGQKSGQKRERGKSGITQKELDEKANTQSSPVEYTEVPYPQMPADD
jgi:hypothetical protein